MSSAAQIEANQQNSRLSTGPITEEGKQKSSLNAVHHGFLARILPQEKTEYHDLLKGLYESFRPQDEFQRTLVDQIAIATIRLRRIYQAEFELVEVGREKCISESISGEGKTTVRTRTEMDRPHPVGEFLKSDTTRNMLRYEVMCQRQIQRNVKLLESLQSLHWNEFRQQPCPYLESEPAPADSIESVDLPDPTDPSDPTDAMKFSDRIEEHGATPFDLQISRHLPPQSNLNARDTRKRRNRNRHPHKNGFVSQNQRNPPALEGRR